MTEHVSERRAVLVLQQPVLASVLALPGSRACSGHGQGPGTYQQGMTSRAPQVSLDVRGKRSLEDSLDFYVQSELMEGENQYLCEEAGQKVCAQGPLHVVST